MKKIKLKASKTKTKKSKVLYLACQVYRKKNSPFAILGLFDSPKKILKTYADVASTDKFFISYGPLIVNTPLSIEKETWQGLRYLVDDIPKN